VENPPTVPAAVRDAVTVLDTQATLSTESSRVRVPVRVEVPTATKDQLERAEPESTAVPVALPVTALSVVPEKTEPLDTASALPTDAEADTVTLFVPSVMVTYEGVEEVPPVTGTVAPVVGL
jgi:hypothetical protein